MGIVDKQRGDDEHGAAAAAGAAPYADLELDPNDPDQVKVHYDLTGWGFEQRAELAETLAERAVPHGWSGEELVVPEVIEADVDALFDELEREIGPFPVGLEADAESTEFGLDEWAFAQLDTLKSSMIEAEIPHRWVGRTLIVARDAEHVVDDLLDAIEAGEVVDLDADAEAPEGALQALYTAADRLVRDAADSKGRRTMLDLVPQLETTAPPFGLAGRAWSIIFDRAVEVHDRFGTQFEDDDLKADAEALREACRPYV